MLQFLAEANILPKFIIYFKFGHFIYFYVVQDKRYLDVYIYVVRAYSPWASETPPTVRDQLF